MKFWIFVLFLVYLVNIQVWCQNDDYDEEQPQGRSPSSSNRGIPGYNTGFSHGYRYGQKMGLGINGEYERRFTEERIRTLLKLSGNKGKGKEREKEEPDEEEEEEEEKEEKEEKEEDEQDE